MSNTVLGKPNNTGIKRIIKATIFSVRGLKAAFKYEAAIRQELVMLIFMSLTAFILNVTVIERVLLIGVFALIFIVELLNSAIEAVVDRVGFEHHELSGRAKDIGSAAVFIALCFAFFTWILILFEHFG
ncbi:diacylglycerol kinase [Aliivibrio sp. S2TY2]|uniref:diacylglycerol kinase n=1 Tax=unclassified Aliivibrio TaxID=2645654 RepID=UPI00237933C1|nr:MULTISPECIES: diacylglycerol kinase [unclassified Aliivibrio]MDD9173495.1 diacylglycerol kinase [Aliivibrio sp. S3TY1]MDD9190571.1 diacylglycerol kinase [Aliivibrio sp. S2TY2]